MVYKCNNNSMHFMKDSLLGIYIRRHVVPISEIDQIGTFWYRSSFTGIAIKCKSGGYNNRSILDTFLYDDVTSGCTTFCSCCNDTTAIFRDTWAVLRVYEGFCAILQKIWFYENVEVSISLLLQLQILREVLQ